MIVVKLKGGLGNQMFQYAMGRALSIRHNAEFKLDISKMDRDPTRKYDLSNFNIIESIASDRDIKKAKKNPIYYYLNKVLSKHTGKCLSRTQYNEKTFYYDSNVLTFKEGYMDGFWQSEKYFQDIRQQLLGEFTLKEPFAANYKDIIAEMGKNNSVSIHFRRGDYLKSSIHGACSLDYYKKTISYINDKIEKPAFFIFSDDIEWVKENFTEQLHKIYYIEPNHTAPYQDLILMSRCKHNIIANSTFSWWSAWLNQNNNKIIITPKQWFADFPYDSRDLVPSQWIRV